MKKTPLAQLIEQIDKYHSWYLEHGAPDCPVITLRAKAAKLLEEERGNLIEAYEEGISDASDAYYNSEYFNETFEQ